MALSFIVPGSTGWELTESFDWRHISKDSMRALIHIPLLFPTYVASPHLVDLGFLPAECTPVLWMLYVTTVLSSEGSSQAP